jgi:hypothetical protein
MAIRDLFWACPRCSSIRPLRPARSGEQCVACGSIFRRGRGPLIEMRTPDGSVSVCHAAEWLDRLPPIVDADAPARGGPDRVRARRARARAQPVRFNGELLGWVDRFEPTVEGSLVLEDGRLALQADDHASGFSLDVGDLTAIQPASRSLQLRLSGGTLWSVRFLDASLLRWDALLQLAVRQVWARTDRGEVTTFQPRICGT